MKFALFTVQTRLLALIACLVVILGGANLVLGVLIQQDESYQKAQQEQFQRVKVIAAVQEAINAYRSARSQLNSAILAKDVDSQPRAQQAIDEANDAVLQQLDNLSQFDPESASIVRAAHVAVPPVIDKIVVAIMKGQSEKAWSQEFQQLMGIISDRLTFIGAREHQLSDAIERNERRRIRNAILTARIVTVLTIALGGLLAYLVIRSIIRPLRATTEAIRHVNAGETQIDLPPVTRDEFGDIAIALRQFRDRAENLQRLAYEDPLTGLGNRAQFNRHLRAAVERARERKESLALLYLDFDHFRSVNDRFGHLTGDRYLGEAATRLRRFIPDDATLYRYGGDNFVVLMEGLSSSDPVPERLDALARSLLRGVAEHYSIGEHDVNMSASLGIALFPNDGTTPEQLVSSADSAMFSAKRNGRNTVRFAGTETTSSLRRQLGLHSEIRRAIERDEFDVFYQPVVDTRVQRVVGAEALMRWRHPQRGIVLPGQFIPAAEESGLIDRLGEQGLLKAHAQAGRWRDEGRSLRVAVNLSVRQLPQRQLLEVLAGLAQNGGERLVEFELTEGLLLDSMPRGYEVIDAIHQLGFRIGLDDFGIGYSSFSYLERLPISKIKIDRSFVEHLETSRQSAAIVSALVALARTLELELVGEGIETPAQSALIASLGCPLQQGFVFSRALPAEDFVRWMEGYERLGSASRSA